MLPVSKDKISKLKYIYKVHQDGVGDIHLEKFPVIYINQKYVYFAVGASDLLQLVFVKDVKEEFPNEYDMKRNYSQFFWFSKYTQEDIEENINALRDTITTKNVLIAKEKILAKIRELNEELSKLK